MSEKIDLLDSIGINLKCTIQSKEQFILFATLIITFYYLMKILLDTYLWLQSCTRESTTKQTKK